MFEKQPETASQHEKLKQLKKNKRNLEENKNGSENYNMWVQQHLEDLSLAEETILKSSLKKREMEVDY